jgi:hypothetical protein
MSGVVSAIAGATIGHAVLDAVAGVDFFAALGPVVLFDFEVPEAIRASVKQTLTMRRYPGGARTADTMGADYDPIQWSGWFEGPTAELRWDLLSGMAAQGLPVPLTWSTRNYVVIVSQAEMQFRRYYHIGYSVSCTVLADANQPLTLPEIAADAEITNALGAALLAAEALAGLVG